MPSALFRSPLKLYEEELAPRAQKMAFLLAEVHLRPQGQEIWRACGQTLSSSRERTTLPQCRAEYSSHICPGEPEQTGL